MVDVTLIGIYSVITSALGTSAHIITYKKITAIQKALKIQRIELSAIEILAVLSFGVQAFESHIWKKEYAKLKKMNQETIDSMLTRINDLTNRVNSINLSTIDMKLDKVLESEESKKENKS